MANCKLDLYFPGWVGVGGGGWVVIIKVKANLSSTGTGLPTGTELGKISSAKGRIVEPGLDIDFYQLDLSSP